MGLALDRAGLETCALSLERTEGPAFCWGTVKVEAFCECDGASGWAWHGAEPGLRLEAEGTAVGDVDRPRCSVLWDVHAAAALSVPPVLGDSRFPFSRAGMALISSAAVGAGSSSLLGPVGMDDGLFSSPRNGALGL